MAKGTQTGRSVFSSVSGARDTRLDRFMRHPLIQFLAFGLFVAVLVAILASGSDVRGAAIDEETIGQVAGADIKATRDFLYTEPDVAATEKLRAEVASAVPPVFDWQEALGERLRDQIHRAFEAMRRALAERARTTLAETNPDLLERIDQAPEASRTRQLLDAVPIDSIVEWSRSLRSEIFAAKLDARLDDQTFLSFARNRFSPRVESALASLVGEAMSQMIVADLRMVEDQRNRGIYLRRLRGDKLLIEYHVTQLEDRFISVSEARSRARDAADDYIELLDEPRLRKAVVSAATTIIRPNTFYNETKTVEKRNAARDAVAEQVIEEEYRKGQVIVEKGHLLTERHFRIVQKMLEEEEYLNRTQIVAGIALTVLLLIVTLFVFGRKNIRKFSPSRKDIVFMATALALMLAMTRILVLITGSLWEDLNLGQAEYAPFVIWVAAGGMLIRLVLDNEHAVVFTLVYAVLVGLITENSLFMAIYTLIGTLVGVGAVQQVKNRIALMWSGLAVGAVNVVAVSAFLLLQGELFTLAAMRALILAFTSGVASGFFVLAVLPLFEAIFGYTTDIKLLELANLNHPLLRELILRAPGSYHHSMMVGSLSEAGAEEIGANALLVRVGAYYHDIGKAKNPGYFAENQKVGDNPHDRLKPNMSALVIKAHVKDGLEMARQHRLPREIQDFIAQHHGTSLISFFYNKAKQMEDPDIPEVDEKDYRYPGPKPQSRETAICMLADGIEAASRAIDNPSPARLKGLVQRMINRAFTDGQLDECDLTLKDLNAIATAFTRILTGIYHHRPEYPDQKKTEKAPAEEPRRGAPPRPRRLAAATGAPPPADGEQTATKPTDGEAPGAEAKATNGEETDADRGPAAGSGDGKPRGKEAKKDDSGEGRESLPRLGTS